MKNLRLISTIVAVCALSIVGCSTSEQEKKTARLESQLAELKGEKQANTTSSTTATPAEERPAGPLPSFAFTENSYDFGVINEGDVVEHIFAFTNNGAIPLIISQATGSCGCTVPEWPKEPIKVGESSEITVKFNSQGKPNTQHKTVTITANTFPAQTKIQIKASVTPKAKTDNPS